MWIVAALLAGFVGGIAIARWATRRARTGPAESAEREILAPRQSIASPRFTSAITRVDDDLAVDGDEILAGQLSLIARDLDAESAQLWQRASSAAPFECIASSGGMRADPATWGTAQQRALASWAATEDIVTFDSASDAPTFVAAPARPAVVGDEADDASGGGVLVLALRATGRRSHADLKAIVASHAAQLSAVWALGEHDDDLTRQNRQLRALVRTALEVQATGDRAVLEGSLTERALEVTGAGFAALVEWDRETNSGFVRRVTRSYPMPQPEIGAPVTVDSIAAAACIGGTPQVWEDASSLVAGNRLFGGSRAAACGASVAVLPLRRGALTIGALVVGSETPGALAPRDLRTARMFAQLAAASLEAAWELEEANVQSQTDALTGLWNRRRFNDTLARVLIETDRFGGHCGLIMTDLDHFKAVNDTHGHEAGDAVLKAVAAALLETVRTTDLCARIGGEEMCVLLPQTSPVGTQELAERLRAAVERAVVPWKGKALRVTASFGVSSYAAGGTDAQKRLLFERADAALYAAKRNGRNRIEVAG
ncbi:MAG: GGDEF domain-containing protein [Gemmatimonadetes bacterium]|nr:GGDEF domain-containing protein [Gemmatimonadota bacterium]